jgi:hypothetical protein
MKPNKPLSPEEVLDPKLPQTVEMVQPPGPLDMEEVRSPDGFVGLQLPPLNSPWQSSWPKAFAFALIVLAFVVYQFVK